MKCSSRTEKLIISTLDNVFTLKQQQFLDNIEFEECVSLSRGIIYCQ